MSLTIRTIDMHTGGEPVRIITGGYPDILGETILDKRRYVRDNLDHLRRFLIYEPRGHHDMYGVIPIEPDLPSADIAVLFMHNQGYSTMCGHAVIALGRYVIDQGLVKAVEPETKVVIQCPCGPVTVNVRVTNNKPGVVRFESVPAFAFARDTAVKTEIYGPITVDIAYGGAFYAVVPANQFGLDVRTSRISDLIDAASSVTSAVKAQVPLSHPDDDDLAFLYGTILTDGEDAFTHRPTANICVFADAQVDRSPTGSGVTARVALQHRRGLITQEQVRTFESVTGALFTGRVATITNCGHFPAVTVEVSGKAHYAAESTFRLENDDEIGMGFLIR